MNPNDFSSGTTIPQWMLTENIYKTKPKGSLRFLRKTLRAFSDVFRKDFLSERCAGDKSGFLQSLDPRVKLLTLIFFVILSAVTPKIAIIAACGIIAALYAFLSHIKLCDFLRRVWVYLPVLLFIFTLPAATNFISRGAPLLYITGKMPFAPEGVYLTAGGLLAALRAALRCGVSLSFGYLLFVTTRFSQLEKAFSALRLPSFFVSVMGMAYRYIFVLVSVAQSMSEARSLRTVGRLKSREGRHFFSHSTAVLFIKSYRLSEEIYDAMCCRGYAGRTVSIDMLRLRPQDFLFIACNAIIAVILILGVMVL